MRIRAGVAGTLVVLIAAVYLVAWLKAGPAHQRYFEVRTNSYEAIQVYAAGSKPPKSPSGYQLVTELRTVHTRADWQIPLAITILVAAAAIALTYTRVGPRTRTHLVSET